MPGKFITNSGVLGVDAFTREVIGHLLDNGFDQLYPATAFTKTNGVWDFPASFSNCILKPKIGVAANPSATPPVAEVFSVDPLSATQPWAIKFEWVTNPTNDGYLDIIVATPLQFDLTTGSHSTFKVDVTDPLTFESLGMLGSQNKTHLGTDAVLPAQIDDFPEMSYSRDPMTKTFLWRQHLLLSELTTYPLSYMLSITARGVACHVWEETSDATGNRNSWFVVQRPVHALTVNATNGPFRGQTVVTGKCPVHCIYGMSGRYEFKPWLNWDYSRTFVGFPWEVVAAAMKVDDSDAQKVADFWEELVLGKQKLTGAPLDITYSGVALPAEAALVGPVASLPWKGLTQAYRTMPKAQPYCLRRFVVREKDVTAPYPTQQFFKGAVSEGVEAGLSHDISEFGTCFGVPADQHTVDYAAIINPVQQVSISEGNRYIITFPNGLNTARFAYTHEMDMVAYTSADVVSAGTEVTIRVYDETDDRVYVGGMANGPNNTGLRILFLKSGGGIPEEGA